MSLLVFCFQSLRRYDRYLCDFIIVPLNFSTIEYRHERRRRPVKRAVSEANDVEFTAACESFIV